MHTATTRMLKILAVVVAAASVVGAVYFWVTDHPIPATGCIVGGTTFLAAAWFTLTREREPSSTAANQKRRRYAEYGLLLAAGALVAGIVVALIHPGFASQVLITTGVGGGIGYLIVYRSTTIRRAGPSG